MTRKPTGTLRKRWIGLLESLRTVAETGLDFVHTHVELFGIELEQELLRALRLLIQGVAALLLTLFAVGFTGLALLVIFWDTHRVLVANLVAGFFALSAALVIALMKRSLDTRPRPFNLILEVLERDRDALRGGR